MIGRVRPQFGSPARNPLTRMRPGTGSVGVRSFRLGIGSVGEVGSVIIIAMCVMVLKAGLSFV